ncbi:hypothetical protein HZS_3740 [Henneguya salminicola]|nr:hypothetical protein HZS_3740 [Henneguya salminicola]
MMLLVSKIGKSYSVILSSLAFSSGILQTKYLAHLIHIFQMVENKDSLHEIVISLGLMMLNSSILGIINGIIFLRTSNIIFPITLHVFCNIIGPPDVSCFTDKRNNKIYLFTYIIGLSMFILLFGPLTSLQYNNQIYIN